jgi:hypothetical protein
LRIWLLARARSARHDRRSNQLAAQVNLGIARGRRWPPAPPSSWTGPWWELGPLCVNTRRPANANASGPGSTLSQEEERDGVSHSDPSMSSAVYDRHARPARWSAARRAPPTAASMRKTTGSWGGRWLGSRSTASDAPREPFLPLRSAALPGEPTTKLSLAVFRLMPRNQLQRPASRAVAQIPVASAPATANITPFSQL